MLGRFVNLHPGPEISRHRPVEDLHHEREERAGEGCVPATLGRFVANECVLSLDFEELEFVQLVSKGDPLGIVVGLPSRSR